MNKEQQELLDEAYENYCKSFENQTLIEQYSFDTDPMTQFMFINKCKTEDALSLKWREEYRNLQYGSKEEIEHLSKHYTPDTEFSERWGLKIEERELSLEERCSLANFAPFDDRFPDGDDFKWDEHTINIAEDWLKQRHPNLPTKLITVTHKDKTIESYE